MNPFPTLHLSRANLWRYVLLLALLFWQGGFLFYSTVVIHVAANVLGNHVEPGFITQRVTNWLNFSGCIALSLLLTNGVLALWRKAPMRSGLLVTWLIMAGALAALILLHPLLDAGLNPDASRPIHDPAQFRHLHQIYLLITTVQWLAAMIHLWCLIAEPRGAPASPAGPHRKRRAKIPSAPTPAVYSLFVCHWPGQCAPVRAPA